MAATKGGIWQRTTAENIVRHRSGTLYLSAKVAGVKVRESLKTENMKVAKAERDARLKDLGPAAPVPGRDAMIGDLRSQLEETNRLLGKVPTDSIARMREEDLTRGDANQGIASLKSLEAMVSGLTGKLESIHSNQFSSRLQSVERAVRTNRQNQGSPNY